jgi:hypothetical protein
MTLARDLAVLGECIAPSRVDGLRMGFLCPRLRTTYSPRVSWQLYREAGAHGPGGPEGRWARVWDYGPPAAALGLSLVQRSKKGSREGLKGLPAAGRKQVWRALALLEEMRPLLSFWTVSLPTAALSALAQGDTWPQFQDRLRKELGRKLQAAGLPALLVGVVELQPKRSRAAGMACPHLHLVFQGRKSRGSHWALSPADLDGVIRAALATAGVPVPDGIDGEAFLQSAGNVQQVRKSVRAYLSKYMTKGGNDVAPFIGSESEALLPRRWWFWSRPLRSWVLEHVLPIAFPFLLWVHLHRQELQELGLVRMRILDLPDPRAPLTFEVDWLSPENCAEVIRIWQDDIWDANWHEKYRLYQWQHSLSRASLAASIPTSA